MYLRNSCLKNCPGPRNKEKHLLLVHSCILHTELHSYRVNRKKAEEQAPSCLSAAVLSTQDNFLHSCIICWTRVHAMRNLKVSRVEKRSFNFMKMKRFTDLGGEQNAAFSWHCQRSRLRNSSAGPAVKTQTHTRTPEHQYTTVRRAARDGKAYTHLLQQGKWKRFINWTTLIHVIKEYNKCTAGWGKLTSKLHLNVSFSKFL